VTPHVQGRVAALAAPPFGSTESQQRPSVDGLLGGFGIAWVQEDVTMTFVDEPSDEQRAETALDEALRECINADHRAAILVLVISKASTRLALLRGTQEAAELLAAIRNMLTKLPPIQPPGAH
jgi:hypothetical protein